MSTNFTTKKLLQNADGRCESWARLFVDVLKAQGIDGAQVKIVMPKSLDAQMLPSVGLFIKNWEFPDNVDWRVPVGGGVDAYRVRNVVPDADVDSLVGSDGIPAQKNDNPRSVFKDHVIVLYGGQIYDPSYGNDPYDNLGEWENYSLAGIAFVAQDEQGQPNQFVFKQSAAIEDTTLVDP